MLSPHTGRRRLGAAVATVLAVTLGAGSLTTTAVHATEVPAATEGPSSLLPMVPGAWLISAGPRGFLTYVLHHGDHEKFRWTPYEGGATRDHHFDTVEGSAETSGDMVVTFSEIFGTEAVDMSTGTSFRKQQVDDGLDSFYAGTAGSALFIRGYTRLWLQTKDTEPRVVQGLPEKAAHGWVRPGDATHGLIDIRTAEGEHRLGLIDLTD
ncbi:hypothetical protein AB0K02_27675, partial [Streptomyces sp. NPDC049597]